MDTSDLLLPISCNIHDYNVLTQIMKKRKVALKFSFVYFSGQSIPRIDYTAEEVATWGEVYTKAVELLPGRASIIHRKALETMNKECGFAADNIPQMEDVSNYLKSKQIIFFFRASGM